MTATNEVQDITYAIATSPDFAQDGICFAARRSGLYRSNDGGDTWYFVYDTLSLETPLATLAVAVSPDFAGDKSVFAGVPGGVLRSFDAGESWRITPFPSPPPVVSSLVISPHYAHDGVLLAGTIEDGVFRSADRGSHWVAWNFGLLDLGVLCMVISADFARDETLFAGTETGLFCSTNGGRAWREVDFPTNLAPVLCMALSPDYAYDGTLFAGTESHGLYRSYDRGHSWSRLGEEILTDAVNAVTLAPRFPASSEVLVMLTDRLLWSGDGGISWSDWKADRIFDRGLASLVAPLGLGPDTPLLVGLAEGGVVRV
jgi:photosystem II stability/assembly factor-like uncharacterized protein